MRVGTLRVPGENMDSLKPKPWLNAKTMLKALFFLWVKLQFELLSFMSSWIGVSSLAPEFVSQFFGGVTCPVSWWWPSDCACQVESSPEDRWKHTCFKPWSIRLLEVCHLLNKLLFDFWLVSSVVSGNCEGNFLNGQVSFHTLISVFGKGYQPTKALQAGRV